MIEKLFKEAWDPTCAETEKLKFTSPT